MACIVVCVCVCVCVRACTHAYAVMKISELELEQRTNIKFLVKLGKNGSEIFEMVVQVYGNNAIKKTVVYKWIKRFSEGSE